jgi:hypothetical protein
MRKYPQTSGSEMIATGDELCSGFIALEYEKRSHVDTACAAYHLGRRPKTLRAWASAENGPIRPTRIKGRLAWPVKEIRRLLDVA